MDDTTRHVGEHVQGAPEETIGGAPGRGDESATGEELGDADAIRRTHEIRSEIEHTRDEMSETLGAIQEKLRPGNIVADATERVKSATTETVREMADSASESARQAMDFTRGAAGSAALFVKEHQLPLALIGIGAAWLLTRRSKDRNGGYGRSQSRRNRSTQNQLAALLDQNPFVVGAGAVVLGALVGLVVPETEAENRMMGSARDSVVERGHEMARNAVSVVEEKAQKIADVASTIIAGQDGAESSSEG